MRREKLFQSVIFIFSILCITASVLIFALSEKTIHLISAIILLSIGTICFCILTTAIIQNKKIPIKTSYDLLKMKINTESLINRIENTIFFNKNLSLKQKTIKLLKIGLKPIQIPLLFDLKEPEIDQLKETLDGEIVDKDISFNFQLRENTKKILHNNGNKNSNDSAIEITKEGINYLKSAFNFKLESNERKQDLNEALKFFEEALKVDSRCLLANFCMIEVYTNLYQPDIANEWEAKAATFESLEYTEQTIKLTKLIMGRKKEN